MTFCSHKCTPQINRIYENLSETFKNPTPTTEEINRALEAMELIASLSENDIAQKSYHLFHIAMQAPVSLAYSQEQMWDASCFTMYGTYKWDKFLSWVEDPQDILAVLDHHLDLATRSGQNQDELTQNALGALAYASSPVTIEVLKNFDPTEPSFVRGIFYVFKGNRLFQLRKAALFFLHLIGDRFFGVGHNLRRPEGDSGGSLRDDQLSSLAPHIVVERWKLLEYFASVPDDSQPLRRCVANPELMDTIKNVANPAALVVWLAILWLKEVAQGRKRTDLDVSVSDGFGVEEGRGRVDSVQHMVHRPCGHRSEDEDRQPSTGESFVRCS